ncbi:MAG: serine--tRNA ligase [Candidatus Abawacabacteria bacterium RBG_16_42_10]|uniref:Serine--tRNA ligase n=1 Tax=Candidatus Abawacabacteria bacterium RBG_16_42_10 TaxID=1817814 RepID=A0A1F4XK28_9BACT|nr:MAG: serine--tRNA ligase [Candidatus Abawacabacteria bacterium RBG_16_42_10]
MIDINLIRTNKELVEKNNASRNVKVDLEKIVTLDNEYRKLLTTVEELRSERNKNPKGKPTPDELKKLRELSETIKTKEAGLQNIKTELDGLLVHLPNINHETTAIGKDDTENKIERFVNEKPAFDFEPKEHFELGELLDLIDTERGAKVSGSRFWYIKNELVLLQLAIIQFVSRKLLEKGFTPMIPPYLVKEHAMFGTGFFPADKNEIYTVNPGEDELYLIGTSEVPLVSYHMDEIIDVSQPKRYFGISPCFRREAGTYGKDTKGIIRGHQFDKIEMVSFAKPEDSWKEHEYFLSIEEEIMKDLGFHYQVVNICTGDLGFPAAKKYDIEAWLPGQKHYRELTSTSNTTDYQARRLNIRYKDDKGKNALVHTVNGTAASMRPLIAIMENYQTKDGEIKIPEILEPFMPSGPMIIKR